MSFTPVQRIPSMLGMQFNLNVSTVANTYETVYDYSGGSGIVSSFMIGVADPGDAVKAQMRVTIDGGTPTEEDIGSNFVLSGNAYLWGSGSTIAGVSFKVPLNLGFNSSMKIEAKNDTDTNAIGISVAASEDI